MGDRMFGEDSFTDEIDSAGQAEQAVEYLAQNEHAFRMELQHEGLSYDDIQKQIGKLWANLAASCKRVGYSDVIVEGKTKFYGIN
jgi:hypothetical protein